MDIYAGIFLAFILLNLDYSQRQKPFAQGFSKEHTNALKGFLAIFIILGHTALTQTGLGGLTLPILKKTGLYVTGVFFALSGYGLIFSKKARGFHTSQFWKKRVTTVVVPYIIMSVIYAAVRLSVGESVTIRSFILSFINGTPIVRYSWFIETIIIFYIGYWICNIIAKDDIALLCFGMLCFATVYNLGMKKLGFEDFWYNSTYCFVLGMLFAYKFNEIMNVLNRRYSVWLAGMTFLSLIALYCTKVLWLYGELGDLMATFAIALLILIVQCKLPFKGNKIMSFLGKHSLEIYMTHGIAVLVFERIGFTSNIIYPICVVIIAVALSVPLNFLFEGIKKGALHSA